MLHTAAVTHLKKETWNRKRETEKQRISFTLMRELATQDKTGPVPTGNTVCCVGTAKIKNTIRTLSQICTALSSLRFKTSLGNTMSGVQSSAFSIYKPLI
jgi:hypothetical protein